MRVNLCQKGRLFNQTSHLAYIRLSAASLGPFACQTNSRRGPDYLYPDVNHNYRLIANDPAVMTWRDVVHIAWAVLQFGAVVQLNPETSGDLVTDVVYLTTIGMRDGLDAFSPSPTWVKGRSHHSQLPQLDDIDIGVGYRLYLVRRVKV